MMRVPAGTMAQPACCSTQGLGASRDCSMAGPSTFSSASRVMSARFDTTTRTRQCSLVARGRAKKVTDPNAYDPKDVRELTELMPDPQKDDLFDDIGPPTGAGAGAGSSAGSGLLDDDDLFGELRGAGMGSAPYGGAQFGGGQGGGLGGGEYGLDDYSLAGAGAGGMYDAGVGGGAGGFGPEVDQFAELDPQEARERAAALSQLDAMYDSRMEWEMQQCQELAFDAHHRIMASATNRYMMAVRMSKIMEEIELQDHFEGEPEYWLPSWVRSYYQLDAESVALNQAQQEYEASLAATDKKAQEDEAFKAINAAMDVGIIANPMAGQAGGEADSADGSPPAEVDPLDEFLGQILTPSAAVAAASGGDDYSLDILAGAGVGLGGDGDDVDDAFDLDDGGGIELED